MAGEKTFTGYQTACTPEVCKAAEVICEEFKASDSQVAKVLDVAPGTVSDWKATKPEFAEALARGRAKQNRRVERALFERAIGYKHPSKKVMQYMGQVIEVPTEEQYPPDVNAIQFWLKNKDPENWKDVSRTEITDGEGAPIPIINVTVKLPESQTSQAPQKPEPVTIEGEVVADASDPSTDK